jgi:benzoate-CoA ligase family protein
MSFSPPARFNLYQHLLASRLEEGLGEKEALRFDHGSHSYSEVDQLSARWAYVITELGVRQEERVLIALPDGPEFVGALFGILRMGAVAVMLNPELPTNHLTEVFSYSRASALICHSDYRAAMEEAAIGASHRPLLLVVGGEGGDATLEQLIDQVPADFPAALTHRDDPAVWLFSGGTTGAPKAVVQSHRSFANTTACYAQHALGYRQEDVTLSVPKLYFGYATGSNLFFPFSVGATSILFPQRPSPELLFDKIELHRPTILINVPSMINAMVSHEKADSANLSSLRFTTSAGEALPEALYHRWKATFRVELLDGLGTAEMWHIFITNTPGNVRPGTVGKVVPGFEIRICDEEGNELPEGEVGRLWVKGDSRAIGYWQNMDLSRETFQGEWFVGGDLVSRDVDGFVTHRGRADDAIKVKGKWLRPQEVESALLGHPSVQECAVIAVADEAGLLKPVAFVVPAGGAGPGLEQSLRQHVLDLIEPYKHPRRIYFLDTLPQTHLGKVDRAKLRSMAH